MVVNDDEEVMGENGSVKALKKKTKLKINLSTTTLPSQPLDFSAGEDINLNSSAEPISYYITDLDILIDEVFKTIKGKQLHSFLPNVLKKYSLDEIKSLCLQEVKKINRKHLKAILEGVEYNGSSCSEDDSEVKHTKENEIENLQLKTVKHEMFENEEISTYESKVAQDVKSSTESQIKKLKSLKNLNENKITDTSMMDLLELEMRARAIRAMIQKKQTGEGDQSLDESEVAALLSDIEDLCESNLSDSTSDHRTEEDKNFDNNYSCAEFHTDDQNNSRRIDNQHSIPDEIKLQEKVNHRIIMETDSEEENDFRRKVYGITTDKTHDEEIREDGNCYDRGEEFRKWKHKRTYRKSNIEGSPRKSDSCSNSSSPSHSSISSDNSIIEQYESPIIKKEFDSDDVKQQIDFDMIQLLVKARANHSSNPEEYEEGELDEELNIEDLEILRKKELEKMRKNQMSIEKDIPLKNKKMHRKQFNQNIKLHDDYKLLNQEFSHAVNQQKEEVTQSSESKVIQSDTIELAQNIESSFKYEPIQLHSENLSFPHRYNSPEEDALREFRNETKEERLQREINNLDQKVYELERTIEIMQANVFNRLSTSEDRMSEKIEECNSSASEFKTKIFEMKEELSAEIESEVQQTGIEDQFLLQQMEILDLTLKKLKKINNSMMFLKRFYVAKKLEGTEILSNMEICESTENALTDNNPNDVESIVNGSTELDVVKKCEDISDKELSDRDDVSNKSIDMVNTSLNDEFKEKNSEDMSSAHSVEVDSSLKDVESVTWGMRWLQSEKVQKVYNTSKMFNKVRNKIKSLKKQSKTESKMQKLEDDYKSVDETTTKVIGSIEEYEKIFGKQIPKADSVTSPLPFPIANSAENYQISLAQAARSISSQGGQLYLGQHSNSFHSLHQDSFNIKSVMSNSYDNFEHNSFTCVYDSSDNKNKDKELSEGEIDSEDSEEEELWSKIMGK